MSTWRATHSGPLGILAIAKYRTPVVLVAARDSRKALEGLTAYHGKISWLYFSDSIEAALAKIENLRNRMQC